MAVKRKPKLESHASSVSQPKPNPSPGLVQISGMSKAHRCQAIGRCLNPCRNTKTQLYLLAIQPTLLSLCREIKIVPIVSETALINIFINYLKRGTLGDTLGFV